LQLAVLAEQVNQDEAVQMVDLVEPVILGLSRIMAA
jgi:hypothetical protein